MTDSDSSTLSSPPSTDDEMPDVVAPAKPAASTPEKKQKKKKGTILSFFNKKSPSPVRKKRPASPPHEMVPEDNPDIPFIVIFRSRFADAFPPKTPHFGPQDLERGVAEVVPSPQVETLLCSLLALLLNRKKPIEKGHYGRALEEAIQTHKSQWPRAWGAVNPITGGRSFNTMSATERITLLKALVLWSLHDSEVVNNMIKEGYKTRNSKDRFDAHIPLSVQPWGRDGDNRRYWLIEGQDDTPFRVYRESNPKLKNITWWSVAGSIAEIRALADKLHDEDGSRDAKQLAEKMRNAIPRFEATEEKRKRREYRLNRQAALAQPVFSLYEGRTRGKRMKYTFSDEEEEYADALGIRRSNRNSARETPAAPAPTITASGRHVKSRATGMYGESLLSGQQTDRTSPATGDYARSEASEEPQTGHGRATRAHGRSSNGFRPDRKHIETYNSVDEMDDEDVTSWDGGDEDEDEPDQMDLDDEEEESVGSTSEDAEPQSLVVCLRYPKGSKIASGLPAPTGDEHVSATTSTPVVKGEHTDLSTAPQQSAPPPALSGHTAVTPPPSNSQSSSELSTTQERQEPPVSTTLPPQAQTGEREVVATPTQNRLNPAQPKPQHKHEVGVAEPTKPYPAPENNGTANQYPTADANARPFQPGLPPPTTASTSVWR